MIIGNIIANILSKIPTTFAPFVLLTIPNTNPTMASGITITFKKKLRIIDKKPIIVSNFIGKIELCLHLL